MIFFFDRDQETLRLETRYDNDAAAFVGTVTYPSGTQQIERFPTIEGFQAWLVAFERRLHEQNWISRGDPAILPYGWPNRRLR
jgi:hypothetical protein